MSYLEDYKFYLTEIGKVYANLQVQYTQLSIDTPPNLTPSQVQDQLSALKMHIAGLENVIETYTQTPKVPEYISGPVTYIYLEGELSSGITQKILLLGDYHNKYYGCDLNGADITLSDFFRFIASRLAPKSMDLFLEADFWEPESGVFPVEEQNSFLTELQTDFASCLGKNKSDCKEPFRIHNADVRDIMTHPYSLAKLYYFLISVEEDNLEEMEYWLSLQPDWGNQVVIHTQETEEEEKEELEEEGKEELEEEETKEEEEEKWTNIVIELLDSYRLDTKRLKAIEDGLLVKVQRLLLTPLYNKLISFFQNTNNRNNYSRIVRKVKQNLNTQTSISPEIKSLAGNLAWQILTLSNNIMELYFITRMLKRVAYKIPPRPTLALRSGTIMTRIIGYFGYGHIFNIAQMLTKIGFNIIHEGRSQHDLNVIKDTTKNFNQCLSYTSIQKAVDKFCK
jgi:hypothetical protein